MPNDQTNHTALQHEANLLRCPTRIPPLYNDVPEPLASTVAASAMAQGMTSFTSPVPRASWDSNAFKGRIAYIRTLKDRAVPLEAQQRMLDESGVQWIVRDLDSGHSPQISRAEEVRDLLVELIRGFEEVGGGEGE